MNKFERLKINNKFGIDKDTLEIINFETGKTWKALKVSYSPYLKYNCMLKYNNKKIIFAHQLLAYNYLYNPSIPDNWQIHHKDGNSLNNSLDNLEFVEPSKHMKETLKNRGKNKIKPNKLENKEMEEIKEYEGVLFGRLNGEYYRGIKGKWRKLEIREIRKNNMEKPYLCYCFNRKQRGINFFNRLFAQVN